VSRWAAGQCPRRSDVDKTGQTANNPVMSQRSTTTKSGFGLLGSLCLFLQPLMALVCCCCCNGGKTANAVTQSPCCASAAVCCVTADQSAQTERQTPDPCCGYGTCCQQQPQFLTNIVGSRKTSPQDWLAAAIAESADRVSECSTVASATRQANDDPPPLQQRLATLCTWRN